MPSQIFDRALRARRRARALSRPERFDDAAWLLDEAVERLAERLSSVKRRFVRGLELGGSAGRLPRALRARAVLERCVALDPCAAALAGPGLLASDGVVASEEAPPFAEARFDLVVSAMTLHWANDLDAVLREVHRVLAPDGLFSVVFLGGDSLADLRRGASEVESERAGGAGLRFSPLLRLEDAAALLQRAGFALPVADRDRLRVRWREPAAALAETRALGESAAFAPRFRPHRLPPRGAAEEAFARLADEEGGLALELELIFLMGWKPHPSQQSPLRPGSARRSLARAARPSSS